MRPTVKTSYLRQIRSAEPVIQTLGKVLTTNPLTVGTDDGCYQACRAASCLLECAAGDAVLLCITPDDAFVLAVLQRAATGAANLSLAGDLNLYLPEGKLRLNASGGVALVSAQEVTITAPRLGVNALEGEVTVNNLSFFGSRLAARLDTCILAAQMISSYVGTICENVARVFRKVEEIEQVQAGQLDLQARDSLSIHGRHTMMSADQLVKVDGAQIHLG
jgi:hypothetical protein